jgi:hypothetical protein
MEIGFWEKAQNMKTAEVGGESYVTLGASQSPRVVVVTRVWMSMKRGSSE